MPLDDRERGGPQAAAHHSLAEPGRASVDLFTARAAQQDAGEALLETVAIELPAHEHRDREGGARQAWPARRAARKKTQHVRYEGIAPGQRAVEIEDRD